MPRDAMHRDWEDLLSDYPAETIETAAGKIGYRAGGRGPALVLLHGIGSGAGSWAYQLAEFSRDYRTVAWDAPGYGSSDLASRADADAYAGALAAMLDALEIEQLVLAGHSLGAIMAARFAVRWPGRVRGVFLADPAAGHAHLSEDVRDRKRAERLTRLADLGLEKHAAERAPRLLSENASELALALVRYNMSRLHPEGYASAASLLANGDLIGDTGRITAPARVVCGSEDRVTPPETVKAIAESFPGTCPYAEIPGAGHASYIEAADRFNAHLRDFLEGLR